MELLTGKVRVGGFFRLEDRPSAFRYRHLGTDATDAAIAVLPARRVSKGASCGRGGLVKEVIFQQAVAAAVRAGNRTGGGREKADRKATVRERGDRGSAARFAWAVQRVCEPPPASCRAEAAPRAAPPARPVPYHK